MSAAPSAIPDESARKIVSLIFQRLSEVGQNEVAKHLSTSDATVSRLKGDVPMFAGMMRKLGLKVVPVAWKCVEPKKMEALLTLAGVTLDTLREKPGLVWEDDQ